MLLLFDTFLAPTPMSAAWQVSQTFFPFPVDLTQIWLFLDPLEKGSESFDTDTILYVFVGTSMEKMFFWFKDKWLIHVNVWLKSLQYCKVISLQLIKINEKK